MDLAQRGNWPNMTRMHELDPQGDKIFIKKDRTANYQLPADLYKFMCSPGNGFQGAFIGGTAHAVAELHRAAEDFLYKEMLPMAAVGNEQMFVFIWHARNNSRLAAIPPAEGWLQYLS
jgi:hypothetical protein